MSCLTTPGLSKDIRCRMDKGHYDKRHYDEQIMRWMQKGAIMMCNLKRRMDKWGNYEVEMKGWMQKVAL